MWWGVLPRHPVEDPIREPLYSPLGTEPGLGARVSGRLCHGGGCEPAPGNDQESLPIAAAL